MLKALVMLASLEPTTFAVPAGFLPEANDVRFQIIEQQAGEKDWPFLASKGRLSCVPSLGFRVVLFFPWVDDDDDGSDGFALDADKRGPVIVTTDPIQLWTDIAGKPLLQPDMTIEDKIRRMAPYVSLGKKLCDQPDWTNLGPSEL